MTQEYLIGDPNRCDCRNSLISFENHSLIKVIPAVKFDASYLADRFDENLFYQNIGRQALQGEIGCALAHQEAYSMILSEAEEWSMVFEDDFHYIGTDPFNERYGVIENLKLVRPSVVAFYTDDVVIRRSYGSNIQSLLKCRVAPPNTLAYMINLEAAKILVEKNHVVKYLADWPVSVHEIDYYLIPDSRIRHGCENTNSTIIGLSRSRPTPRTFIKIQMWTGLWFIRYRPNWTNFPTYFASIVQPRLRYKMAKIKLNLATLLAFERRN